MLTMARGEDGSERDSRVLMLGHLGGKGRQLGEALRAMGYAIQWETEPRSLRTASVALPPLAIIVACTEIGDPFAWVRWLRAQRTFAHAVLLAWVPAAGPSAGDGIAAGADDILDAEGDDDDLLDRVAARIARARAIEERTYLDCVTQLRNRRYLAERLPSELALMLRRQGRASMAVLDVDGSDSMRRESGRAAVDRALECFAFSLRATLRSMDVACRVDDRTFLVILPGLDTTSAAIAIASVDAGDRGRGGTIARLHLARAFAEAPRDGTTWQELLDAAERRLRGTSRLERDLGVASLARPG